VLVATEICAPQSMLSGYFTGSNYTTITGYDLPFPCSTLLWAGVCIKVTRYLLEFFH
jgi:hypothetical protein